MITIDVAKRLVKRAVLANLTTNKKDLAITPLVSGKHGIGKSQMIKSLADELGGYCITIEGGTLKEGEITGLPYLQNDDNNQIKFRFLPYYAIERIQEEEKRIFYTSGLEENYELMNGEENKYSINNLSSREKIAKLTSGDIKPVIIFIDEINRTESTVYKELMNILLTRSVNGYQFPWWVFFVGAMNPSTQNSVYATNEMDPAQLDRFLKIKVSDNTNEWLKYGQRNRISNDILNFIKDNPNALSSKDKELLDEEKPKPSPRGWDMIDTLLKSNDIVSCFFSEEENDPRVLEKDMKEMVSAKLGGNVATMFFASLVSKQNAISADDFFNDDITLTKNKGDIIKLSASKKVQTSQHIIDYLKENIEYLSLDKKDFDKKKEQLRIFAQLLDAPTKLLFAQNLANATSEEGNQLIEYLFDVFEVELLKMLDLSEKTRKAIKNS